MKQRFDRLLFDLDGTITDSKEGIFNCLRYAIGRMGREVPGDEEMMAFLGPPLWDSFVHRLGYTEAEADEAVFYYRERFQPLGIYENRVYPGMEDLLHRLSQRPGVTIWLATAKPLPSARKVLDYFHLTRYFDGLEGATFDNSIKGKNQVISRVLQGFQGDFDPERTLMIGDRNHDVDGARENGIRSLGVLYGYGSREEIGHADFLVEDVPALAAFLLEGK